MIGVDPVNATTLTGTAGVGVDITLNHALGFRFELQDQMAADPIRDQDIRFASGIAGTARPQNIVHVARLTAGITLSLH